MHKFSKYCNYLKYLLKVLLDLGHLVKTLLLQSPSLAPSFAVFSLCLYLVLSYIDAGLD